ncbi:hypothetical protein [Cetobacterium sp.]|uniref:hypothetical protein n=1 Tax=Cetobacterium sp. TaxID=2071632 RepID=UPI003EE574F0
MKKEIVKYLLSKGVSSDIAYNQGKNIGSISESVFSRMARGRKKVDPNIFRMECEKELRIKGLDLDMAKLPLEVFKGTLEIAHKILDSTVKFEETLNEVILDKGNSDAIRMKAMDTNYNVQKEKFKMFKEIGAVAIGVVAVVGSLGKIGKK